MGLNSNSSTYRYKDFNNGSICLCNEDGKVISDSEADADSTRKIVFGSNGGAIASKGDIWTGVSRTLGNVESQLTDALDIIKNHWHGDAADNAYAQLTKLRDTAGSLSANSGRMGSGLQMMGKAITDTQAAYPDINDDNAGAAWSSLKNGTNDGLSRLPTYVERRRPALELRRVPRPRPERSRSVPRSRSRASGPVPASGPGRASARTWVPTSTVPTTGRAWTARVSTARTSTVPATGRVSTVPATGRAWPDPASAGPGTPAAAGSVTAGRAPAWPVSTAGPAAASARADPVWPAVPEASAAGWAVAVVGGGLAGGVGGGLGGAGSSGAGGSLGVAGGPNIGGVGSAAPGMGGGAGRGGMMAPMMGRPGGGGDDDERERSTWLNEDDDLWGTSDAPPPVIS